MDFKKIVLAGFAATVVSTIFGYISCGWLFNWVYTLEPINIWKPMIAGGSWFIWMILGGLVLNIILAAVFATLYKGIPGQGIKKGLYFGVLVWLVGILPGMFSTHITMTVATTVVVYWTLIGLARNMLLGAVIATIYKQPEA